MSALPDDPDALLQALVCGDLDPASPAVLARLAADPELATRWREFSALDNLLGDAGQLRADALAAAAQSGPLDDEAELLARIRAGVPPARTASGFPTTASSNEPHGRWRMLLAAAAMVAVVLGAALFSDRFDGRSSGAVPEYRWLGEGGFGIAEDLPFGEFGFQLRGDDALDAEVTVRVHAVDASGDRGAVLRHWVDPGTDPVRVPPELLESRDALDWEIEVRSALSPVPRVHRHRQTR